VSESEEDDIKSVGGERRDHVSEEHDIKSGPGRQNRRTRSCVLEGRHQVRPGATEKAMADKHAEEKQAHYEGG
jgi:hypothetical protein